MMMQYLNILRQMQVSKFSLHKSIIPMETPIITGMNLPEPVKNMPKLSQIKTETSIYMVTIKTQLSISIPTLMKSWQHPHQKMALSQNLMLMVNIYGIKP